MAGQQGEPVSGAGSAVVPSKARSPEGRGVLGDGGEVEGGKGAELVSSVTAGLWRKHGKISSHTREERVAATARCGDAYFSLLVPPVLSTSEICAHQTQTRTWCLLFMVFNHSTFH